MSKSVATRECTDKSGLYTSVFAMCWDVKFLQKNLYPVLMVDSAHSTRVAVAIGLRGENRMVTFAVGKCHSNSSRGFKNFEDFSPSR